MKQVSERAWIAKVFKKYIEMAIEELGIGYTVTLQGTFNESPIRIEIEISSKSKIP